MKHCNSLVVFYAVIIQAITAGFVIAYPVQLRVARLGIFYDIFPTYYIGGICMLLVALLALAGLFIKGRYSFLFFIPQYLFLLLTSGSAMSQIAQGQYADGVVRAWPFIFIDQLPDLTITALYIFSIVDFRVRDSDTAE